MGNTIGSKIHADKARKLELKYINLNGLLLTPEMRASLFEAVSVIIVNVRENAFLHITEYTKEHGKPPGKDYKIWVLSQFIDMYLSAPQKTHFSNRSTQLPVKYQGDDVTLELGLTYLRTNLKKLPKKYIREFKDLLVIACGEKGVEDENIGELLTGFESQINNYVRRQKTILKDGGLIKHKIKNMGEGFRKVQEGLRAGRTKIREGLKAGETRVKEGIKTGKERLKAIKSKFIKRPRLAK